MFPRKRALHEPNRAEQVNDISFPTTHVGSPVVSRGDGPGVPVPGGPSSLARPHPAAAGICHLRAGGSPLLCLHHGGAMQAAAGQV